jgi:hypothetical protein
MQTDHADEFAAHNSDKDVITISAFAEKFTNRLDAAIRQLQRVADGLPARCNTSR